MYFSYVLNLVAHLKRTKMVRELTFSIVDDDEDEEGQKDETEGEPNWFELVLEELEIDEDRLREEMEAKREEYEGLVTQDSSLAILVARDHGDQIIDEVSDARYGMDIDNIVCGLSGLAVECKVEEIQNLNKFDGGQVRSILVSDDTGRTQISFWDEDAEKVAEKVERGDIIRIDGCYTKKEMSDYQQDRFGTPGIQFSDDATLKIQTDDEFVEAI